MAAKNRDQLTLARTQSPNHRKRGASRQGTNGSKRHHHKLVREVQLPSPGRRPLVSDRGPPVVVTDIM